jgi:demethylmenaquinone methyltransferase/2-methoxy-6-polyprenyl-1,4-benzoquinol methylase
VRARPGAARVVGVDFAGAMLRVGHAKADAARLRDRVTLVRGDATRVPSVDTVFDAVTIAFGIRNVQDVPAACREMRRVLKPGGRLALLEFTVPSTPVISTLYLWYLRHVLPRIGRAVSHHDGAYGYLPASIDAFASPDEFMKILRQAGFVDVAAARMSFGAVCLYTATRDRGQGTGD